MVVGDHVCVTVFGLVHFQVGVLPGELLTRVNGLEESGEKTAESEGGGEKQQMKLRVPCSTWDRSRL